MQFMSVAMQLRFCIAVGCDAKTTAALLIYYYYLSRVTILFVSVRSRPLILTGDFLILARGLVIAMRPPSLHLPSTRQSRISLYFR
jgi:hypothetical protein